VYSGTLTSCTLSGNTCPVTGAYGGGAYGSTLNNCTLSGNVTGRTYPNGTGGTSGGGAYGATLNNCTLSGNIAYGAGASGGGANSSTLNHCSVSGNSADFGGGGAAGCTSTDCNIFNNTAGYGGGGVTGGTLFNCVLTGNFGGFGGGIYWTTTLYNCTITGNSAGYGGGGFNCTLHNCVIYYNSGGDNDGDTFDYCCTPDAGGVGCITVPPLFADGAGHLQTYSPCINAGNNAYVATSTDLDGNPRIVGGTVDMGAYENQSATASSGLPSVPTNVVAVLQSGGAVISWSPALKAAGYDIWRASTSGGVYTNIASGVATTSYTDGSVVNGGTYYYEVTAVNAYGQSPFSPPVGVAGVDHFSFAPVASPQTSSVPFNVVISACDINGAVLTNFAGATMLSAAGDHGNAPLTPAATAAFVNGQWNGAVAVASSSPDTNIRLFASSNGVAGVSNPFNAVAPAVQSFNLTAADLVYDPFAQLIYVTVPAGAASYPNSLVVIDPVMGRVQTNYNLGNGPSREALSDDGQFLYIGFSSSNGFCRFNLASRTVDLEASLGDDSYYTYLPEYVSDLAALPGSPHSIAIAENTGAGAGAQVVIFDDGIMRSNLLTGLYSYSGTVVAASATRLYAGAPYTQLTIDETGIVTATGYENILGLYELIKYQGGLIFRSNGEIFNAESVVSPGSLTNCSIVEPDLAAGRIFSLGPEPSAETIYSWNSTNLQVVDSLPVPGFLGSPGSLIRWGANGLAFSSSQNQIFLVRTSLVPPVAPIMQAGARQSSGSFQLSFTGDPSRPYNIWASSNLVNWTLLGPANPVTNGWFQYLDPAATNWPQRFYRAGFTQ
jgi:hypothetical protein